MKTGKRLFLLNLAIFFLFFIIGYILPLKIGIEGVIIDNLRDMINSLPSYGILFYIFFNNVRVTFTMMLSGFLFLSIPLLAYNGYITGSIMSSIGIKFFYGLLTIAPHGIFEITAAIIAATLGVYISASYFRRDVKKTFLKSLKIYFKIVVPLLFVAAIIETILIILI